MFSVNFFREDDGTKPVGQFIRTLEAKLKAQGVSDLNRLQMIGKDAREPLSKHLEDGIFECRTKLGTSVVRTLYFFDNDMIIIVTNSFFKKQQKTPKEEIALAKKRRKVYFDRKNGY